MKQSNKIETNREKEPTLGSTWRKATLTEVAFKMGPEEGGAKYALSQGHT